MLDKLPINMKERKLSSEFITKSDKDIQTIKNLSEVAQNYGAFLGLSGGYATESLCGGNIFRPHGDIDGRFIFPEPQKDNEKVMAQIDKVLNEEDTKWVLYHKDSGKLEYREDVEKEDFFDARRVELYFPIKGFYDTTFEDGQLIDSHGEVVKVKTVSLTDLVISKIQKLYSFKDGYVDTKTERETNITDLQDLKRLMSVDRLDKNIVIEKLTKKTKNVEKAEEEWGYAQSQVEGI